MKEIKEVATLLKIKNYQQAAKLLKKLQKEYPQNLWVQLYIGRWYEEIDKLESAEKFYRKLLKGATNPQVVLQARQGLQRIENIEKKSPTTSCRGCEISSRKYRTRTTYY